MLIRNTHKIWCLLATVCMKMYMYVPLDCFYLGIHPTTISESFEKAAAKAVEILTAMSHTSCSQWSRIAAEKCHDFTKFKGNHVGIVLSLHITWFVAYCWCAVTDNIHTSPMEGQWEFQEGEGGGGREAIVLKEKYGAKLEFLEGWGANPKKAFHGEVWIFSGATQWRSTTTRVNCFLW